MLQRSDFKDKSGKIIDWIQAYFTQLESYPVKSKVQPKEVYSQIPIEAPDEAEDLDMILSDLTDVILPGITHWQHPNFHAYFPANSSIESLFAEFITAAIGSQCMIWDTSPAAAELEERMMEWLRIAMDLPKDLHGVIQDTASTATLSAIITAREVKTNFTSNQEGVPTNLRVYCSSETHSSVEKSVAISGIGKKNLCKIEVDDKQRMNARALETQIQTDISNGYKPTCVIATIGTTGTLAIDSLEDIGKICQAYDIWFHVDAAYAGSALILPEYKWMAKGLENADSFVFNPHKWMFTNFDCTAYFVKRPDLLIKTFEVLPEFLKTTSRGLVNDYRDWGIPLGRRFRALKLWFVLRGFGINGIRNTLRKHIALNQFFADKIKASENFELMTEPILNMTCFRCNPSRNVDLQEINTINQTLLNKINEEGKLYLTHTKIDDTYVIRMVIGQTYVEKEHVEKALHVIRSTADTVLKDQNLSGQ